MTKHQQYRQYELNGGSMTMEEWEFDGRYDRSAINRGDVTMAFEKLMELVRDADYLTLTNPYTAALQVLHDKALSSFT